jgi:hypothetical protein
VILVRSFILAPPKFRLTKYKRRPLRDLSTSHSPIASFDSRTTYTAMDFFASPFTIASDVPEFEPSSTPIDKEGGGGSTGSYCIVA